jgi:hypothetical membrane protein
MTGTSPCQPDSPTQPEVRGPAAAAPNGRFLRRAAVAGMSGPVLFVTVFTVEGARRPGYCPLSMFVSELSLGPAGWVQVTSFLVTGALVVVFGRGLARYARDGGTSRAGPVLLQIIGLSLMASGPFTTDPSSVAGPVTWHGMIHGLFGAVVFTLAPVTCFVFYRRFRRDPAWRPLAGWTLAAAVLLALGIGVLRFSQVPEAGLFGYKGLVQRVVLVTFMAWLFAVGARLHRVSR